MWDYVFVLTCAGDVASRGASHSRIKLEPSIKDGQRPTEVR